MSFEIFSQTNKILIRSVFLYLDRTYVIQTAAVDSIWDMALSSFRQYVMLEPQIQNRTVNGLLLLILEDR